MAKVVESVMRNTTILVVDDDALIRWSLIERLKSGGYRLLEADSGAAALESLEGVDLVLLDYQLPDIDGVLVLRKIKAHDPDTPVIMLTAHAGVATAVEAMKLGAFNFANKTFNLDDIAAICRTCARNDAAAAEYAYSGRARRGPSLCTALSGIPPPQQRCDTWWRESPRARRRRFCSAAKAAPARTWLRRRSTMPATGSVVPVHEPRLFCAARALARKRTVRSRAGSLH